MRVRNNICWRIRDSDLSLLSWSWGLCIFVEWLCLVASRQVSHHLKGRSVCHASPPPPSNSSPPCIPLLFSTSYWVSMGSRPNKQTNRTTEKPITQTRLVWAWGGRWGEILFAFWASSISLWWQRRPPRTRLSTLLFNFCGRGEIKVVLSTDTSSSDLIHTCSLYLSWPCTL